MWESAVKNTTAPILLLVATASAIAALAMLRIEARVLTLAPLRAVFANFGAIGTGSEHGELPESTLFPLRTAMGRR